MQRMMLRVLLLILGVTMLLMPLLAESAAVTLLDRAEVLKTAAAVTPEKYADADKVLLASYEKIRYNPDGTAVTLDDTYEKILTEKGKRENRVITLHFTLPYSQVAILHLSLIKPDGRIVELAPDDNSREMVNPSQMGENIYNPNSKMLQVSLSGLETGDIIHTVSERQDVHPRMRDTWCGFFVFEHDCPIVKYVVEIDAPKSLPPANIMLKDPVNDTVTFTKHKTKDRIIYRWEANNVPQFFPEPSMPPFYMYAQRLLVSTVRDWRDISRWYWQLCLPHLEKVSPEMREKVAELTAGPQTPEEKMQAIFHFVSTQIRYMGLTTETEAPGYEPSDVDSVFKNRYGVCRDKAALLVAMLRLADIKAWPVLFYVGPKKDSEVPNNFFNHAICCAELKPGEYTLMDPTDENTAKLLPDYLADKSYVVAKPDGEKLMTSPVIPAINNLLEIETIGEVGDDLSLTAETSMRFAGINDTVYRGAFARWRPDERRQFFTRALKYLAPGAELEKLRITPENLFDMAQPLQVKLEYRAPNWLIAENQTGLLQLPWAGTRFGVVNMVLRATGLRQRRFPLKMFSTCGVKDSFTLTLPRRYQEPKLPTYGAFTTPEMDWRQEIKQEGNMIRGNMSFLIKTMEFSPAQYLILKDTLKNIEFAKSKMPILAVDPDPAKAYPDANALILSENVAVTVENANAWTETATVKKKILNYAGVKQNAELRFAYNPAMTEVNLLEASVIAPDGSKKMISQREINIMDQSWVGAAPRYSPGKILVVSLPGVEKGSVIEYTVKTRSFNQPFIYGRYLFQGSEPVKCKKVSVSYPESLPLSWEKNNDDTRLNVYATEHPTKTGCRVVWAEITDMPAIKTEPSVPPAWAFVPQLVIYGSNWEKYAGQLHTAFEKAINNQPEAKKTAISLAAQIVTGNKKGIVKKIRDYVASSIRDTGPPFSELPLAELSPADKTLRDGYGHAADRAILLCAMLRPLGFTAEPLPVSMAPACLMLHVAGTVPDFNNVLVRVEPETSCLDWIFPVGLNGNKTSVDSPAKFPVYLNDSNQYARLGTVAHQQNWLLDLNQGRIVEKIADQANTLENRLETNYDISLNQDGAARVTRQVKTFGINFQHSNQRFAEMTPEKRNRYHQKIIAALSQAAEPIGQLTTVFDNYPGLESLTVEIPTFAVRENDYLYWQLPGFPLKNIFSTGEKTRNNPFYQQQRLLARTTWMMHLPENTHTIDLMPAATPLRFVLPENGGQITISSEIGYVEDDEAKRPATLSVSVDIDLQPTVIPVELYHQLEQINMVITKRLLQTVMLKLK